MQYTREPFMTLCAIQNSLWNIWSFQLVACVLINRTNLDGWAMLSMKMSKTTNNICNSTRNGVWCLCKQHIVCCCICKSLLLLSFPSLSVYSVQHSTSLLKFIDFSFYLFCHCSNRNANAKETLSMLISFFLSLSLSFIFHHVWHVCVFLIKMFRFYLICAWN